MQRGSDDELYYCEETQTGIQKICMLRFEKEAAIKTEIFSSRFCIHINILATTR